MILIDSREKPKAITKIIKYFEDNNIDYDTSKLYVGDYQSLDNFKVIVDRKQNLAEIMQNVTQKRFRDELIRAKKAGIHLIILIEHSRDITSIDDIIKWKNPRLEYWKFKARKQLCQDLGGWSAFCEEEINKDDEWDLYKNIKNRNLKVTRPPQSPEQLCKALHTIESNKEDYDVEFQFCSKTETGAKIIELLKGEANEQR